MKRFNIIVAVAYYCSDTYLTSVEWWIGGIKWQGNWHMNPHACLLIGLLLGLSVGPTVCHNFTFIGYISFLIKAYFEY